MIGTPSICRIVHYRLNADDVTRIRTQRDGTGSSGGNPVYVGDVYPAMVVRTYAEYKSISAPVVCNLQVLLDGPDTLRVTSVHEAKETQFNAAGHGFWCWPPRQDMTQEGR